MKIPVIMNIRKNSNFERKLIYKSIMPTFVLALLDPMEIRVYVPI